MKQKTVSNTSSDNHPAYSSVMVDIVYLLLDDFMITRIDQPKVPPWVSQHPIALSFSFNVAK